MQTVAFHTLGCKVNQYDTEAMNTLFRRAGYETVPFEDVADVYVINTCTVTHQGDRKSRQLIRRARRRNPGAVVVVTGCFAQTSPGEAAGIPGVSLVLGNSDKQRVVELVQEARKREEVLVAVGNIFSLRDFGELDIEQFTGRTRAPVKVQDGCREFCTYCIIPFARGTIRSRPPEEVREQVARLAAGGIQEVVLTGIHLGAYGRDLAERPRLTDLLEAIHDVDGIERIRISSLEPMDADRNLLRTMSELPKVCHHLHLPIQSGSDSVLKRMRRRYTTGELMELIDEARYWMPDISLTTDVMAGFPGETGAEHEQTVRFIEQSAFTRLHVFPFSARKGTPAADYSDQVSPQVKSERVHELLALSDRLSKKFYQRFVGQTHKVLIEDETGEWPTDLPSALLPNTGEADADDVLLDGLTQEYVRVFFRGRPRWRNRFVYVDIEGAGPEGVWGTVSADNFVTEEDFFAFQKARSLTVRRPVGRA